MKDMVRNINGKSIGRNKRKGSALVEFALGSTILIPLLFGTADFGRLFYASIEVANAAAAGASYVARTSANMTDTSGISSAAKNDAADFSSLQVSSSEVCQDNSGNVVSCSTWGAYKYVKVTATYTFQTLFSYPAIPSSVALSKSVMMRGV
jgi:Flp pilus assembly protein TadG